MARLKAKTRKATIGVQVINITCECGGICANDRGSSMIEEFDVNVGCTICGQMYNVPVSVFNRKWRTS